MSKIASLQAGLIAPRQSRRSSSGTTNAADFIASAGNAAGKRRRKAEQGRCMSAPSARVPPAGWRALQGRRGANSAVITVEHDKDVQEILAEALNMVFSRYGRRPCGSHKRTPEPGGTTGQGGKHELRATRDRADTTLPALCSPRCVPSRGTTRTTRAARCFSVVASVALNAPTSNFQSRLRNKPSFQFFRRLELVVVDQSGLIRCPRFRYVPDRPVADADALPKQR